MDPFLFPPPNYLSKSNIAFFTIAFYILAIDGGLHMFSSSMGWMPLVIFSLVLQYH